MPEVKPVTDADFQQVVLQSDKPVFVDYWATWCSPCKQLAPIIDELAAQYGEQITFVKINADENPVTPGTYGVRGLPTLQIFKDGVVEKSLQGGKTKGALVKALEEYL